MINEYINNNYERLKKELRNTAKNADEDTYNDLFHHSLLIFLEHQKTEDAILNNQAQFFLARIMLNQWRTDRSDFRRFDRKHTDLSYDYSYDDIEYDLDKDYLIEIIIKSLDEMISKGDKSAYRAHIIIYYFTSNENFNEVSRKYNIKASTARYSFIQGIEELKTIIENNDTIRISDVRDYLGSDTIIKTLSKSDRLFRKESK